MVTRTLFIIGGVLAGFALGSRPDSGTLTYGIFGGLLMGGLSVGMVGLERMVFPLRPSELVGGLAGFSIGVCLSGMTSFISQQIFLSHPEMISSFTVVAVVGFCSVGTFLGIRMGKTFSFVPASRGDDSASPTRQPKLLDTSAIIDGRIADLSRTGFFEGPLIVPQFVLHELQRISDSSDDHKRTRGKRGMDVLQELMDMETVDVHILDADVPQFRDVDAKLMELAKLRKAKIVTTDMNLNKIASVQGIRILNTHELSNVIRQPVLPGESLTVFLLREGKEAGQGVAHLDDGTMVVVDHARRWIGKHVEVVVTRVIQTNAGRMIFSSLREGTPRLQVSYG